MSSRRYHGLTLMTGCFSTVSWIVYCVFFIVALRMMRGHLRAERAVRASGRKISAVLCGMSLPTLLRFTLIGCTSTGVFLMPFAPIMSWLKVSSQDRRGFTVHLAFLRWKQ